MIECLSNMSVQDDESSLMEYTRKWTLQVNRGGLFEINDMTYNLFKEIELKVRHHLFVSFHRKSSEGREAIIGAVCKCDNIQFYWTILSIDILVEENAIKLLEEMVGLWVTIRGYSIAGAWLEHHKHINKISTVKALRKDLKRKASHTEDNYHYFNFTTHFYYTYQSIIPSHDCLFVAIIHFLSKKY